MPHSALLTHPTPDDRRVVTRSSSSGRAAVERHVADAADVVLRRPRPRRHRVPVFYRHLHAAAARRGGCAWLAFCHRRSRRAGTPSRSRSRSRRALRAADAAVAAVLAHHMSASFVAAAHARTLDAAASYSAADRAPTARVSFGAVYALAGSGFWNWIGFFCW